MRVEHSHPDGGEGLLAIVVSANEICLSEHGAKFFTPAQAAFQVGYVRKDAGQMVKKHVHLPVRRQLVGTAELLMCMDGAALLRIYTSAGEEVYGCDFLRGDVAILLSGAHSLEPGPDGFSVFEVKQGPYAGSEDKRYL